MHHYGVQNNFLDMRGLVVDYMRANPSRFHAMMSFKVGDEVRRNPSRRPGNSSPKAVTQEYVDAHYEVKLIHMSNPNTPGNYMTLVALAMVLKKDIMLVNDDGHEIIRSIEGQVTDKMVGFGFDKDTQQWSAIRFAPKSNTTTIKDLVDGLATGEIVLNVVSSSSPISSVESSSPAAMDIASSPNKSPDPSSSKLVAQKRKRPEEYSGFGKQKKARISTSPTPTTQATKTIAPEKVNTATKRPAPIELESSSSKRQKLDAPTAKPKSATPYNCFASLGNSGIKIAPRKVTMVKVRVPAIPAPLSSKILLDARRAKEAEETLKAENELKTEKEAKAEKRTIALEAGKKARWEKATAKIADKTTTPTKKPVEIGRAIRQCKTTIW